MKTDTFPFEAVYEHFARKALSTPLPKEQHPPALLLVHVQGHEVVDVESLPQASIFFANNAGKELLGKFLNYMVPKLPERTCVLLISEAYMRATTIEKGESADAARKRAKIPNQLDRDPLAEEILLFQMYRPGQSRIGRLPIGPGRSLSYRPLDKPYDGSFGRLMPDNAPAQDRKWE